MAQKIAKDLRDRLRTISREVRSLTDHASSLSSKVNFLLDATLGMVNSSGTQSSRSSRWSRSCFCRRP